MNPEMEWCQSCGWVFPGHSHLPINGREQVRKEMNDEYDNSHDDKVALDKFYEGALCQPGHMIVGKIVGKPLEPVFGSPGVFEGMIEIWEGASVPSGEERIMPYVGMAFFVGAVVAIILMEFLFHL